MSAQIVEQGVCLIPNLILYFSCAKDFVPALGFFFGRLSSLTCLSKAFAAIPLP